MFDSTDTKKFTTKNYVTGQWALTIKRDADGSMQRCKARWVLRGFRDRQGWGRQTDWPTASRPGFLFVCQLAANSDGDFCRMGRKTAFRQGEDYDLSRGVLCELPPKGEPATVHGRKAHEAGVLHE